jgi:hypothetical protein
MKNLFHYFTSLATLYRSSDRFLKNKKQKFITVNKYLKKKNFPVARIL